MHILSGPTPQLSGKLFQFCLQRGGAGDRCATHDVGDSTGTRAWVQRRLGRRAVARHDALGLHAQHAGRDPAHHGLRPASLVGRSVERVDLSILTQFEDDTGLALAYLAMQECQTTAAVRFEWLTPARLILDRLEHGDGARVAVAFAGVSAITLS